MLSDPSPLSSAKARLRACAHRSRLLRYEAAVARIMGAARERRGYGVSALAIHGVMTTVFDRLQRARVAGLDLVPPTARVCAGR